MSAPWTLGMNSKATKWANKRSIFWVAALSILCIVCFPVNPLVLSGVIETSFYPALLVVGWVVWAFGITIGTVVVYMSCKEEDKCLIEQFGDDYVAYMKRVPRMDIFLGAVRLLRHRRGDST